MSQHVRPLLWLLLVLLPAGCGTASPGPIYLGHLLPAHSQEAELQGLQQGLKQLQQEEASLPEGRELLVIHAEQGRTAESIQAQAVRLVVINQVQGLVGGLEPDAASAIARVAEAEQVLAICLAGSVENASQGWVLPLGIAPAERGRHLAEYAQKELKAHRPVLVKADNTPPTERMVGAFQQHFPSSDAFSVVTLGEKREDRRAELKTILQTIQPDLIVLACSTPTFSEGLDLLIQSSIPEDTPIIVMGPETVGAQLLERTLPSKLVLFATAFSTEDPAEEVQAFVRRYTATFGEAPNAAAALAYDAVQVYASLVGEAGSVRSEKVRALLRERTTLPSFTGTLHLASNAIWQRTVYIVRVVAGRFQREKTVPASLQ